MLTKPMKMLKSTILITKSRSEPFISICFSVVLFWSVLLVLVFFVCFGRALLQTEEKSEQLCIGTAHLINCRKKNTGFWTIERRLLYLFSFSHLIFPFLMLQSIPPGNQPVLHGRLLCLVLRAAEQHRSRCCFEPKSLCYRRTRALPGFL